MSNLGAFIRAHRERVSPATFGLAPQERSRTPGLRREDLARLCKVSTTWITWLEQGRPVSASAKMLVRLAGVLRLSPAERSYLFQLAGKVDPDAGQVVADGGDDARAMVDAVQAPAYVLDRQWHAVAWNAPAAELFDAWLGPRRPERNLLRYMFLQASARDFIVDWPGRARRLVAEFRADCGKAVDASPVREVVRELLESSAEFRALWQAQDVLAREGGMREFAHPRRGLLSFNQQAFQPLAHADLRLVLLLAA